ncbi:MAG: hypothetical protein ACERKN_22285 [Velocimicrobium sp.]
MQKKYGFKIGEDQAIGEVIKSIEKQFNQYKTYKDNPAVLTFQEAEDLLKDDLVNYQTKASNLAQKTGLKFLKTKWME